MIRTDLTRLAALLILPAFAVACGDGDGETGTDVPVPVAMQKTGGDQQSGPPGTTLSEPLEVKVTDEQGRGVPDFTVSFSATAGTLSPQSMDTDSDGRAQTTLTLPEAGATVTVTASGGTLPSVQFTATSVPDQLGFRTSALAAGRTGVPYGRSLEAVGGSGSGYSFQVTSGALPGGMELQPDGSFSGAPTETGSFPITVRVTDGDGAEALRSFTLETCGLDDPLAVGDMAPGEVRLGDSSRFGECGVWIPNESADRYYRVALVRTNRTGIQGAEREVTTTVSPNGASAGAAAPELLRAPAPESRLDGYGPRIRELARKQAVTSRLHGELLEEGREMLRRLGPSALARATRGPAAVAAATLPERLRIDVTNSASCNPGQIVTAFKIAEDERLGIYQDSAQQATASTEVSEVQAQMLLDYYEAYGKEVIDTYFDGVDDIDSNGKIIVFVTPEASDNILGFVWPGDLFSKESCAASNEAELIYMGVDEILALTAPDRQFGFGLATLVHEAKHVSSIFEGLNRGDQELHPLWLEEGSAEIASTRAARTAWAARGGPAVTDRVARDDWIVDDDADVDSENAGLLLQMFRVQASLSRQPNSVIVNTGNGDDVYGSGWLLLRWIGDAYGDAAQSAFADAGIFRAFNDRSSEAGVPGLEAAAGDSWEALLTGYLAASMYSGTPVEEAEANPMRFTSWNLVSSIEMWCFAVDPVDFEGSGCDQNPGATPGAPGAYPWPVTTTQDGSQQFVGLEGAVFTGNAGQGGFRVHDFVTDGSGVGAEITLDVQDPARVVVVRVR